MKKQELFEKKNYQIDTLDDEINADQKCTELLKYFHQELLNKNQEEPLQAGSKAAGADYFLREFVIGFCRENIFSVSDSNVKEFAGHWYIIKTLEPNMVELASLLEGTASFYNFCADNQLIDETVSEKIQAACSLLDYFEQRIEDFHNITGDGYRSWEEACPL